MRAGINVMFLLNQVAAIGTGNANALEVNQGANYSLEATVAGTGAVSATIDVYGSHTDGNTTTGRTPLYSFVLSGTTRAIAQLALNAPYKYLFADLTAISGTLAKASLSVAT